MSDEQAAEQFQALCLARTEDVGGRLLWKTKSASDLVKQASTVAEMDLEDRCYIIEEPVKPSELRALWKLGEMDTLEFTLAPRSDGREIKWEGDWDNVHFMGLIRHVKRFDMRSL